MRLNQWLENFGGVKEEIKEKFILEMGGIDKIKDEGGMGFRDLAMFVDSLLAKHAWRLLQNLDSLFYKFFKARLFPNCSIMEAKESSTGSYA